MTRRLATCLLAFLLLCVGCGKKSAPARPVAVNETPAPVANKPWTVPGLRLELVYVEAGSFRMGSEVGEEDEKPVHEVRITRPFWMGTYEVTQAEYEALAGSNPSRFRKGMVLRWEKRWAVWDKLLGDREVTLGDTSDFLVEQVSWDAAVAFCVKLMRTACQNGTILGTHWAPAIFPSVNTPRGLRLCL